jgi:hypothetical protein
VSAAVRIIAVIAVIGYVIGRQLMGEPLRGRRVVVLPVILTIIGVSDLGDSAHHLQVVDEVSLVISGLIVATIGAGQGWLMRLESRNGVLWGQAPAASLWLWLLLVVSRLLMTGIADWMHAHVAAGASTILLMLGVNRLAQAAVIVPRAMSAGIPFAPEKDGKPFLAGLIDQSPASTGPVEGSRPGR